MLSFINSLAHALRVLEVQEGNLGSDGHVYHLNCGDEFTGGVHICSNSSNLYALNIYKLIY